MATLGAVAPTTTLGGGASGGVNSGGRGWSTLGGLTSTAITWGANIAQRLSIARSCSLELFIVPVQQTI